MIRIRIEDYPTSYKWVMWVSATHPLYGLQAMDLVLNDWLRTVIGHTGMLKDLSPLYGGEMDQGWWRFETANTTPEEARKIGNWLQGMENNPVIDMHVYEKMCVFLDALWNDPKGYPFVDGIITAEFCGDDPNIYKIVLDTREVAPLCQIFLGLLDPDDSDFVKIWEADRIDGVWTPWWGNLTPYPDILRGI